jgi:hypothetical protein
MIIQIRGTSGSGKSTVMRRVMEGAGTWIAHNQEGRKRPLYYTCNDLKGVAVLGHYESACGGCDTVGSAREVFELILSLPQYTILCEGLLLSEDVKWSSQLKDLHVLFLTTPLEQCLTQIKQRRTEAGNEKPLNPENTSNRVATIERARVKLSQVEGVHCYRCSANQAPRIILNWLHAAEGKTHGSGTSLD